MHSSKADHTLIFLSGAEYNWQRAHTVHSTWLLRPGEGETGTRANHRACPKPSQHWEMGALLKKNHHDKMTPYSLQGQLTRQMIKSNFLFCLTAYFSGGQAIVHNVGWGVTVTPSGRVPLSPQLLFCRSLAGRSAGRPRPLQVSLKGIPEEEQRRKAGPEGRKGSLPWADHPLHRMRSEFLLQTSPGVYFRNHTKGLVFHTFHAF